MGGFIKKIERFERITENQTLHFRHIGTNGVLYQRETPHAERF